MSPSKATAEEQLWPEEVAEKDLPLSNFLESTQQQKIRPKVLLDQTIDSACVIIHN